MPLFDDYSPADHDFTAVVRGVGIPGYYTRTPDGRVWVRPTLFAAPPEGTTREELDAALAAVLPPDALAARRDPDWDQTRMRRADPRGCDKVVRVRAPARIA